MAIKYVQTPNEIYQIKLPFLEQKPPIWRRLLVPASLTLLQLHELLQAAMGWLNSHMHGFRIGQKSFLIPDPENGLTIGLRVEDERRVRLFTVLGRSVRKLYTPTITATTGNTVLWSKRSCSPKRGALSGLHCRQTVGPPEDCGGIPGFYNLLETMSDPEHEDSESMLDWLGGGFNPEHFSVDEVNEVLAVEFGK